MSTEKTLARQIVPYCPPEYWDSQVKVLFVGKATSGPCQGFNAADIYKTKQSLFWHFGRDLCRKLNAGSKKRGFVWTNIFKQGVSIGNPGAKLAKANFDKSVKALKDELKRYEPDLIVMVSGEYFQCIPYKAFQVEDIETKTERSLRRKRDPLSGNYFWYRSAYKKVPPILWINHPQGKDGSARSYRAAAIRFAKKHLVCEA